MLISGISHSAAKSSKLTFAANKVSATSRSESKDKLVSGRQFNAMIVLRSDTNRNGEPESEKPCQRVSNVDRKVFANPESFCNMLIIG